MGYTATIDKRTIKETKIFSLSDNNENTSNSEHKNEEYVNEVT